MRSTVGSTGPVSGRTLPPSASATMQEPAPGRLRLPREHETASRRARTRASRPRARRDDRDRDAGRDVERVEVAVAGAVERSRRCRPRRTAAAASGAIRQSTAVATSAASSASDDDEPADPELERWVGAAQSERQPPCRGRSTRGAAGSGASGRGPRPGRCGAVQSARSWSQSETVSSKPSLRSCGTALADLRTGSGVGIERGAHQAEGTMEARLRRPERDPQGEGHLGQRQIEVVMHARSRPAPRAPGG